MAARDADGQRARLLRSLDVERGVAHVEDLVTLELAPGERACPPDRLLCQLDARVRGGPVAAEREVAVEVGALELGMGRGLGAAGREPEQVALVAESRQELLHARQHPISPRVGDRLRQVALPPREQLGKLAYRRLTPD